MLENSQHLKQHVWKGTDLLLQINNPSPECYLCISLLTMHLIFAAVSRLMSLFHQEQNYPFAIAYDRDISVHALCSVKSNDAIERDCETENEAVVMDQTIEF